jgi:nucleoside-diphosphate-sugar epimerase
MKAFITGGTGHVGSTLVEVLLDRGHEVHCLVRETSDVTFLKSLNSDKLFFQTGDLTSLDSLRVAVQEAQPDYIFHAAAAVTHWAPWKYFYDLNVLGTQYVVDAMEKTSSVKKLVYVSTCGVYGYESLLDVTEDQPYGKLHNYYSKSKIMVEEYLWEKYNNGNGLPLTMIRPPSVFGPHDRMNLMEVLGLIKHGRMLSPGKGDQLGSWAYTFDIADLLLQMAEDDRATGEAFNVKNADITSRELMEKLIDLLDIKDAKIRSIPVFLVRFVGGLGSAYGKLFRRKNRPLITRHIARTVANHHTYSIEKAKKILGWTPKFSFDDALKKTVDWFIESGTYDAL